MNKVCVITSGFDWNDAGVDVLILDSEVDIERLHSRYKLWYKHKYLPKMEIPFSSFADWLISHLFARNPTEDEVIMFHED